MDLNETVALIEKHVAECGRVTGAKLSQFLRSLDSTWSPLQFGQKSIAQLISTQVPKVAMVGRAGLDPVYGPATPGGEMAAHWSGHHEPWRVWASPNSPFSIEISSEGSLRVVESTASNEPDWTRFESPDANEHRKFARDFILLQFPGGDQLLASTITDNPEWWRSWFTQIRKRKLNRVWGEFRAARLLLIFEESLRHSGLTGNVLSCAVTALKRSAEPGADLQLALSTQSDGATKSELRHIAALVIDRMGERELAELRLPLGLVLDAIKSAR